MKKVLYAVIIFNVLLITIVKPSNNFVTYLGLYVAQNKVVLPFSTNEEGFLAGTQVATPSNFKSIENLKKGDVVIGYDKYENNSEQTIITIFSTKIPEYIKIITDDEIICAGSQQKFYVTEENKWVTAENLQPWHCLVKNYKQKCHILLK